MEKLSFLDYTYIMIKTLFLTIMLLTTSWALNCSSCGSLISGQFWKGKGQYGEQTFCDSCYKTLKKCSVCRRPSASLAYDGEKYVCPDCQALIPRCDGCSKLITGNGWQIPGDNRKFCENCKTTGDVCDVCGSPIPQGQGVTLEAKRKMCVKCKDSAVTDIKEAERIYSEVTALMEKKLGLKLKTAVPIEMVNREEMKKAASASMKNKDRLFGLFTRDKKKCKIYFLYGTPRHITMYTLAHEFAHAWQNENAVKGQPDKITEGFAEWAAYKILLEKDDREAAKLVEQREDNVYGAGFKYFKNLEDRSNINSVVRAATYYKGR